LAAKIIDGKAIAEGILAQTSARVAQLKNETGRVPGLAAVLVGDDAASKLYVANKRKACARAGIYDELHHLPGDCHEDELVVLINNLNNDPKINGILVQLPLPSHIHKEMVLDEIALEKDVDGISSLNLGKLVSREECFTPATALAVLKLIESTGEKVEGKNIVVVGESVLIGRPVSFLLLNQGATVTTCHRHTKNLAEFTKKAEVLVSAVGKPNLITHEMVREGAIVIDVGITEVLGENGKRRVVGDVDFEAVKQVASWITPVPGGVGPVTVEMLLKNTVKAFEQAI